MKVLSQFFELYMSSHGLNAPEDFLIHAVNAMLQLEHNGQSNVLYNLAKGIGIKSHTFCKLSATKKSAAYSTKPIGIHLIGNLESLPSSLKVALEV